MTLLCFHPAAHHHHTLTHINTQTNKQTYTKQHLSGKVNYILENGEEQGEKKGMDFMI